MALDVDCSWVYNTQCNIDEITAIGGYAKWWGSRGGSGDALRCYQRSFLEKLLVRCKVKV